MENHSISHNCILCPRKCNADRRTALLSSGGSHVMGYCGVPDSMMIARAALHMWEEPCISGSEGSGAIFFSGCNMRCVFCQNREISGGQYGREVSPERLADICLKLQDEGANNINLVTPSHYVIPIIRTLEIARSKGLTIPVVYNTSSYELTQTLSMLEGYVDIYLPDCKYYSDERAMKYSNAPGYFDRAFEAIEEMHRQVGACDFDDRGMLKKGVIIRHLVLPEGTKDSRSIIGKLYERFGDEVYFSLMNQYTPMEGIEKCGCPELMRKVTKREYDKVVDYAIGLEIENAFIQEGETAKESFIPPFDLSGV